MRISSPRAVGVHHEDAEIGAARPIRRGVGERNQIVGVEPARNERLFAVDAPALAVRRGDGVDGGEVGAGFGFVKALPSYRLPAQTRRDEAALLFRSSPDHHGGNPAIVVAHAWQGKAAHLLHKHHVEPRRQPAAAHVSRPGRRKPALLPKLLAELLDLSLIVRVQRAAVRRHLQIAREVLEQPSPRRRAKRLLLLSVRRSKVHESPLLTMFRGNCAAEIWAPMNGCATIFYTDGVEKVKIWGRGLVASLFGVSRCGWAATHRPRRIGGWRREGSRNC